MEVEQRIHGDCLVVRDIIIPVDGLLVITADMLGNVQKGRN